MKIAIASHSRTMIGQLREILSGVFTYQIIWVANSGEEVVKKSKLDLPDLIIMDLNIPHPDGVEATRHIMKNTPCAILIITSNVNQDSSKVFEAMGYGALDVVKAPKVDSFTLNEETDEILKKIETIGKLIGKSKGTKTKVRNDFELKPPPLLVIGASTGGPMALATIISKFPKDFEFATIIVQHLDEKFSRGFANWLKERCSLPIEIAAKGTRPTAGKIFLAGKNKHLVMSSNLTLDYTSLPLEIFYRPSVDVFFSSLAENWPSPSIAVLLTGMGSDGAKGMKALHEANWYTVAEHKNSCIVYGMPKAAIEMGAVSEVAELNQIASKILAYRQKQKIKG